jgi:hypothetical protein
MRTKFAVESIYNKKAPSVAGRCFFIEKTRGPCQFIFVSHLSAVSKFYPTSRAIAHFNDYVFCPQISSGAVGCNLSCGATEHLLPMRLCCNCGRWGSELEMFFDIYKKRASMQQES